MVFSYQDFSLFFIAIASIMAAFFDIKQRIIPNILTASLTISAILLHALLSPQDLLSGIGFSLVVLFIGFMFFIFGIFGAGDVKFIAASCLLLSPHASMDFIFSTLFSGSILGIVFLIIRQKRNYTRSETIKKIISIPSKIYSMILLLPMSKSLTQQLQSFDYTARQNELKTSKKTIPYGVAIALGAVSMCVHRFAFPALVHP